MKSFLIDNFTAVHLKKLVEKAREAYANERAVERQIAKLRDQIQLFADEYAAPGEPVLKEPPAKLTGSIWQAKLRREEFAQKKRNAWLELEKIILQSVPDSFRFDDSEAFAE